MSVNLMQEIIFRSETKCLFTDFEIAWFVVQNMELLIANGSEKKRLQIKSEEMKECGQYNTSGIA